MMVNEVHRHTFDSVTPLSKVKRGVNISSSESTLAPCHYVVHLHTTIPKNEVQEDNFLKEHKKDHYKKLHDWVGFILLYAIVKQND